MSEHNHRFTIKANAKSNMINCSRPSTSRPKIIIRKRSLGAIGKTLRMHRAATYWKKRKIYGEAPEVKDMWSGVCWGFCGCFDMNVVCLLSMGWVTCAVVCSGEQGVLSFWILWGDHLRIRLVFTVLRTLWSYRGLTFLCPWKMGSSLQESSKFKRC